MIIFHNKFKFFEIIYICLIFLFLKCSKHKPSDIDNKYTQNNIVIKKKYIFNAGNKFNNLSEINQAIKSLNIKKTTYILNKCKHSNIELINALLNAIELLLNKNNKENERKIKIIISLINKKIVQQLNNPTNSNSKIKSFFLKKYDTKNKENLKKLIKKINSIDSGNENAKKNIEQLLIDLRLFIKNFDEKILKETQLNNKSTARNLVDIKKSRQEIIKIVERNRIDIEKNTKTLNKTSESIKKVVSSLEDKIKLLKRHASILLSIHVVIFVTAIIIEVVLL